MNKKIISKIVAALVSCAVCVSMVVNAADVGLTLEDTYNHTGFTETMRKNMRGNLEEQVVIEVIKVAIEKVKNIVENTTTVPSTVDSFKIPNYTFVEGKQLYEWTEYPSMVNHQCLVCCSVIDTAEFYDVGDLNNYGIHNDADDSYYFMNALNYRFYYDNGYVGRYVVFRNPSVSQPFLYYYNTTLEVNSSGWSNRNVYAVDNLGNLTATGTDTGYNMHAPRFTTNDTNDIGVDIVHYTADRYGDYVRYFNTFVGSSKYPSYMDIICGSISMATTYSNGENAYNNSTEYPTLYYTSWVTTNDNNLNNIFNSYYVDDSEKVYYYNEDFSSNTVIDNSNVNNVYDGSFNTVIGIELPDLIAALPDLIANLQPSLELPSAELDTAIHNHFDSMPDIGFTWNDGDNDNNYYDLTLPDSGGGGSGDITVNIDITRPDIPYIDTSPTVSLYVPTVTTTALPINIARNSKKFIDVGKDITDMVGVTDIIIWCGLVGVGVMLIFKDW